ncbi:phage holin family protein [Desulfonatronovibrio hydrogenovorans]|uniref:phage holin family protein n=1 Tax=Desulfonatronovibrio hydrogenovorans TaxID=53245 RepID=UPI00048AA0D5|nr:phage holin family protein [Desulfonatronovibrio hydrogenovorans]
MHGLLIRWLILTAAILICAYVIDGIHVSGFFSAFVAAAFLGILNALLRPVLILLTLPINILTLGLFTFVINAVLLLMVSGVVTGLEIRGFWSALGGALIIGLISWLTLAFISDRGRIEYIELKKRRDRWE